MPSFKLLVAVAIALITLCATAALAEIQTCPVSADAMVTSHYPDDNFGGSCTMTVGWNGTYVYRAYLKFDMSPIVVPSGYRAVVVSTLMRVYALDHTGNTSSYPTEKACEAWSENSITWNNQPSTCGTGGNISLSTVGWQEVGLPPPWVQGWIDNGLANYGIRIKSGGEDGGYPVNGSGIEARECTNDAYLIVTYSLVPWCVTPGVPISTTPACGSQVATGDVPLAWNAATNATSYDYELFTNGTCSGTPAFTGNVLSPTYTWPGVPAGVTYSWHVRARNSATPSPCSPDGIGDWSTSCSFTTPSWGACCDSATGTCTLTLETECSFSWLGAGVLCSVEACAAHDGAVWIPAGDVRLGQVGIAEPVNDYSVAGFYIDRYEVSNAKYKAFIDAGGYTNEAYWNPVGWVWRAANSLTLPLNWNSNTYHGGGIAGNEQFPVNGVSWWEADAYCRWAGGRLPTEAEWEKAAKGGCETHGDPGPCDLADVQNYPWGEFITSHQANYGGSGDPYENNGWTTPVGFYNGSTHEGYPTIDSPSPYGLYDVAGNVWEWCSTRLEAYPYDPNDGRENPPGSDSEYGRVRRGGSSYDVNPSVYLRCAFRNDASLPSDRSNLIGFRCAASPVPTGSCCATDGTCTMATAAACTSPSTWQGAGTTCTPNQCPQPNRACCVPSTGSCTLTTQDSCAAPDVWHSELASCTPNPCPVSAPILRSVADIGNDQGRQVRLRWRRALYDAPNQPVTITGYTVFRELGLSKAEAPSTPPGRASASAARDDLRLEGWDYVLTMPAFGDTTYLCVAPTLCDSTISGGLCLSTFMIRAMTPSPFEYYDSAPLSGYSVDNLAPTAPANLRFPSPTILAWNETAEADFDFYSVYGSSGPAFDPQAAVLIGHTTSPAMDVADDQHLYFHVTATDVAGNEGPAADIQNMTDAVDGGTSGVSRLLVLMAPNPSAGGVVIRCLLPLRTLTTVALFDASGRIVRRLHEGDLPAGETPLSWDGRDDAGRVAPAGVYLVRISTPAGETSGRLVLTR